MGMLGALAGFGQGLQDYSKVLQKKQEQDWLDQQARVKYEREQNLESLRMSNQKEMQKAGFTHAEVMADKQNTAADARFNKTFGLQKSESEKSAEFREMQLKFQEEERKRNDAFRSQQLAYQAGAPQRETDAKIALVKEMNALSIAQNKEQASAMVSTLKESGAWDQFSKTQQAYLMVSANNPTLAPHLATVVAADKGNKLPADVAEKIAARAADTFDAMKNAKDSEPWEIFQANFQKENPKTPPTEANLRSYYTMDYVTKESEAIKKAMGGSPTSKEDITQSIKKPTREDIQKARMAHSPEGFKSWVENIKKVSQEYGAEVERLSKTSEYSDNPSGPPVSTGSQFSGLPINQLKRMFPQNAKESYKDYEARLEQIRNPK